MVKGIKKKLIVLALSVSAAAAGVTAVVVNYRDGEFKPDAYANSRERNENQIVFPGQDMSSLGNETSDESELWEQDQNSDENLKPEDKPTNSMLFETMKVADASSVVAGQDNTKTDEQEQPSEDTVYVPDMNPNQNPEDTSGDTKEDVIVIPSGTTNGTGTGGNHAGQGDSDGNAGDSGNGTDSVKPSEPEKPSKDDTGKDQPSGGNDKPSKPKDLDTTVPKLPTDDTLIDAKPYPGDDKIQVDNKEDYEKNYSLRITQSNYADDAIWSLYEGEYLNDDRVLCSVVVYLDIDGKDEYRLTELNENFKMGEYPEQVTGDSVDLTFYYRPGEDYDWIKGTYHMDIRYSAKVLIQDWTSGKIIGQKLVEKDNTSVSLLEYYYPLMQERAETMQETANELFLGFSETEGGTPLPQIYNETDTGAKILYPVEPVTLDDSYILEWKEEYLYVNNQPLFVYLQSLTGYNGEDEILDVPYGVQIVELQAFILTDDWDFIMLKSDFDQIKIPSSVLQIDNSWMSVHEKFDVDSDNLMYVSQDGMLMDKEQTVIYDIPDTITIVEVPETVEGIFFKSNNQIEELHFLAEDPIENLYFGDIVNAKIYVPADAYLKYMTKWGKDPAGNGNELLAEEDNGEALVDDGTCIYTADMKTLMAVKSGVTGVLIIPEGVEKIAASAFENCGTIDMLILPTTIQALEDESLLFNAPEKIVFMGTTAPEIDVNTFSLFSELQVLTSAKETYLDAWSDTLGDMMPVIHFKEYQLLESDGFTYMKEGACALDDGETAGTILLKALEDLVYFDENSKADVTWTEIAACAFAGNTELYMAEIPASVKVIGREAFARCTALQGVISYSTDEITIKDDAFSDSYDLRFVALNAMVLDAYYYWGQTAWYGVCDAVGDATINRFSPKYYLVEEADGILLYGQSEEDENACYLLSATDKISGTVHLKEETSEIGFNAFRNCGNPFTVVGFDHLIAVGDSAFSGSGLQGDIVFNNTSEDTLVYLGSSAFENCYGITSVSIMQAEDCALQMNIFAGCSSMTSVTFGEDADIVEIGDYAFAGTALSEIAIPASVEKVGKVPFSFCMDLVSITFAGSKPPILNGEYHNLYYFTGSDESMEAFVHVPKDCEQVYLDAWKYSIIGYLDVEADMLSDTEKVEALNRIRQMLGMELLELPEEPENPDEENKTTEEEPVNVDAQNQTEKENQTPVQLEDATPSDAE